MLLRSLLAGLIVLMSAVVNTTVYVHRAKTHRALKLHPLVDWFCRLHLWLTTGQSVSDWVRVHRKHHAHTDIIGDPHSPYLEGFWQIQFLNVIYYIREVKNPETLEPYGRDLKEDRWDRWLFNRGFLGPSLGLAGLCLVLGVGWGLFAAAVHSGLYVFVLASSINGLCHHKHPTGYQNYKAAHASTTFNNVLVAFLTAGEGFHHNHHFLQSSAKFAHKKWEIIADWGWWVILILEKLHLAYDVKRPNTQTA